MNALKAIAFDLYGTLFDVHTVAAQCEATFPGKGQALSIEWRRKQLEYTWLRTLMKRYVPFEDATRDALRYVCRSMQLPLDDEACNRLCDAYLHLHAYPEVPAALGALKATGVPLAILSNGSPMTIRAVTSNAGLDPLFDHLLSVDAVQAFKPHEHAYGLAEEAFGVGRESILFVSSNAWDATGARNFGFTTAWINRHDLPFEELGESPDWQVRGLDELAVRFRQALAD